MRRCQAVEIVRAPTQERHLLPPSAPAPAANLRWADAQFESHSSIWGLSYSRHPASGRDTQAGPQGWPIPADPGAQGRRDPQTRVSQTRSRVGACFSSPPDPTKAVQRPIRRRARPDISYPPSPFRPAQSAREMACIEPQTVSHSPPAASPRGADGPSCLH